MKNQKIKKNARLKASVNSCGQVPFLSFLLEAYSTRQGTWDRGWKGQLSGAVAGIPTARLGRPQSGVAVWLSPRGSCEPLSA